MLAVTASFSSGVLSVFGDSLGNSITLSRNAAGAILVNGGAVSVVGGTPTVANTTLMQVFGLDGNDTITLNETNGALPKGNLFGGGGNDVLIGGSAADFIFGQAGNDVLQGKGGADLLFGGAGNDTLTGGDADDQVFGENDNDRLIWNPGDDTDLNEGGGGDDTVEVNGGNGAEMFTITANGTRVRFDRVNPAPFSLDIGTSENLIVNANGGDDSVSAGNGLAPLIKITMDGGTGNDTLLGSDGADLILGGDGSDFIDGNRGNDTGLLGAGDDVFQWDPGDGSDTVEGQDGTDRLIFNGANISEKIDVAANGGRVRFFRDVANVTMDLNDVEGVDFNALGGPDTVTINDLSGTDLVAVRLDLAAALGGTAGDGQPDTVIVNGTNGDDTIDVVGAGTAYSVVGLPALVSVLNSEPTDALVVNALGGVDTVNATTLPGGIVHLTVDGGAGIDTLLGSAGGDTFLGGDGNDFIDGNRGNDVAFLGAGDDVFQWDPGDGNDTVEGQDGTDRLVFNGANINENIDIAANGGRVRFFRDVANVTMDLDDVERIDFNALGGADTVVVGDLSGTDAAQINLALAGTLGGTVGDGQADTIVVNGSAAADAVTVTGTAAAGAVAPAKAVNFANAMSLAKAMNVVGIVPVVGTAGVSVLGLAAVVNITTPEGANDILRINAQGGDDVVNASTLPAGRIGLQLFGGLGNDFLIGSPGNDFVNGGDGNDTALLGAGDDTFVWNPGDDNDIIEGQDGADSLLFNGANISERIDIAANGGRVLFLRDVANVTMDLNDVERIDFNALGGADTITVNDLSGTDVTEVNLALAGTLGGSTGDGQADNVIVQGTNGDDVILVTGDLSGAVVLGLAARINITTAESANDRLTIHALAGDDVIEASGLLATSIMLLADGGDGADVLVGGEGNDVLQGGDGDDVLLGGPGLDVLDGGLGDDIEIQG